ncbi:hypothetical protein FMEAI12_3780033 [Parafrankia sp. Ea1.12]|nr:hypothetical protein FMEAI12_3780033 [Parafrankia sp. Ea1.12]
MRQRRAVGPDTIPAVFGAQPKVSGESVSRDLLSVLKISRGKRCFHTSVRRLAGTLMAGSRFSWWRRSGLDLPSGGLPACAVVLQRRLASPPASGAQAAQTKPCP